MFGTIISTDELERHLGDEGWVAVDIRSKQGVPENGERAYAESHVPGALYANLDRDLSGPHVPGETGRHPLPDVEVFVGTLSHLGIDSSTQVVVYDDMYGAYAARLWWMLRWLGHDAVAVLDGGWQKWISEGRQTDSCFPSPGRTKFEPEVRSEMIADVVEVERNRRDESRALIDARTAERFCGENEILDPKAGHIPGAISMQYSDNLTDTGVFRSPDALRARFSAVAKPGEKGAICYCGSGVTAAHNILAMVMAGLDEPRLYVGSWSHWITDSSRPIA